VKGLKVFCVWVLAITVTVVDGQSSIAYLKTRGKNTSSVSEWPLSQQAIVVPFQFSGNHILIQAELGQEKGWFLLDTGSPALILNEAHPKKEVAANGVNAAVDMEYTTVKWFRIEQAEWKNLAAFALDLRQLEASNRHKLLGLIGYDVLRKSELLVDPQQKLLYLLPADELHLLTESNWLTRCSIGFEDHLPIVEIELDGRSWRFGIDTGAEANLINSDGLALLSADFYQTKGWNNIRGVDQQSQLCPVIHVQKCAIGGVNFGQTDFTVLNLKHLTDAGGIQLDGIIGSDLLNRIKYSINYRKRSFTIWEKYK
jgi:hypothetical protein